MIKPIAKTVAALSLILSASFSVPAWAGNSTDDRKCTEKRKHAKPAVAAPAAKPAPAPARGTMTVERRKLDVQILSFGP